MPPLNKRRIGNAKKFNKRRGVLWNNYGMFCSFMLVFLFLSFVSLCNFFTSVEHAPHIQVPLLGRLER